MTEIHDSPLIFNVILPASVDGPDGPPQAIPLTLLRPFNGVALQVLLSVWFTLELDPRIYFRHGGARITIGRTHTDSAVKDEQSFLDVLPMLRQWVEEWAKSPTREPDIQPARAAALGLSVAGTKRLAIVVVDALATSSRRVIPIAHRDGVWIELILPPRDCLQPPSASRKSQEEAIVIGETQRMAVYQDAAGGQTILIPEAVVAQLGEKPRVDARAVRRQQLRAPKKLVVRKAKKAKSNG